MLPISLHLEFGTCNIARSGPLLKSDFQVNMSVQNPSPSVLYREGILSHGRTGQVKRLLEAVTLIGITEVLVGHLNKKNSWHVFFDTQCGLCSLTLARPCLHTKFSGRRKHNQQD